MPLAGHGSRVALLPPRDSKATLLTPPTGVAPASVAGGAEPVLDIDDLVGHADAARRLVEWLELTFRRPELLTRLGGSPRLGVLLAGAEGVGKATLVRSAAAAVGARCIELAAPAVAALEPRPRRRGCTT
jgi:transitional endoplasmic reticulum ATPase